jgi:hypothetical protein
MPLRARRVPCIFGANVAGTLAALLIATIAHASAPVSYTVTGCVQGGEFASGPYKYQVVSYVGEKYQPVSLAPYENKTVRIKGYLSPGDRLSAHTISIVDDKCRPELQTSKFN